MHANWLSGSGLALDPKAFVLTGQGGRRRKSAVGDERASALAVADVRSGSVKRIVAAVGEGAQGQRSTPCWPTRTDRLTGNVTLTFEWSSITRLRVEPHTWRQSVAMLMEVMFPDLGGRRRNRAPSSGFDAVAETIWVNFGMTRAMHVIWAY